MNNEYLYKTNFEDWGNNHARIWRLKIKLEPEEWGEVSQYFKFYRNKNLVGWGTIDPLTVTEILVNLRGSVELNEQLNEINAQLQKHLSSQRWGYERDIFGEMEMEEDNFQILRLKKEKKKLLGF